jgi:hypothetical protein
MSRRRLRVADVAAALVVIGIMVFVVAGPLTDNPPPTHAEYVAKADKVCRDIETKQAKLDAEVFKGIPYDKSPPDRLWSEYAKRILPTFDEQLDALRQIDPPKGDAPKLERYFQAVKRVRAVWAKVAKSPKNAHILDESVAYQKADDLGQTYGFRACAHAED